MISRARLKGLAIATSAQLVQTTGVPEQDESRNKSLRWLTYCKNTIFVYIDVKKNGSLRRQKSG
ncbi:Protein of unknown function [Pyronema omphalodes CBS 100304]|uniref:Uncharacterized protein n=1 Tax=Pyronema omphalodes (strain CBS 100304) TaxID=1076935 RepID=U4LF02_PYROM|nr:Protein of unknown function [Pyronema omphalodes CBS 100304]